MVFIHNLQNKWFVSEKGTEPFFFFPTDHIQTESFYEVVIICITADMLINYFSVNLII